MNPEVEKGVSQSGFRSQDVGATSPRYSKRCRDESEEEERHPTGLGSDSECVKTMDLNLLSDGGREDQGALLSDLTVFQSEKRIKFGPSDPENNSQTPISSSVFANKDVLTLDGDKNVTEKCVASDRVGEGGTQFWCDICSVKCTSTKDLQTHLAGKKHARAQDLVSMTGTASIVKISHGGSKSEIQAPQKVQASTEHNHADVPGEASESLNSSGIIGKEVKLLVSSSKSTDFNDAKVAAVELHSSLECSPTDPLVKLSPRKVGWGDSYYKNFMNGIVHSPTLITEGFLDKLCGQVISEGEPYKYLAASLSAKSHSDCVARALASMVSFHDCRGLGYVQGSSSGPATDCLDSQLEGAKSTDNEGVVSMHTRCLANLLHDVRIGVMEDLLQHACLKTNSWQPSSVPISASAPSGEGLNCSVCRVEYGSKADLDHHVAGRKHASLVQRTCSRCQLCNLNCNSEKDFKMHLSGKKHASKLRLVQKRVNF